MPAAVKNKGAAIPRKKLQMIWVVLGESRARSMRVALMKCPSSIRRIATERAMSMNLRRLAGAGAGAGAIGVEVAMGGAEPVAAQP